MTTGTPADKATITAAVKNTMEKQLFQSRDALVVPCKNSNGQLHVAAFRTSHEFNSRNH